LQIRLDLIKHHEKYHPDAECSMMRISMTTMT
jgi:hypothetical protein